MKEQYLRSVGQLLDCPRRRKKRLLRRLDSAVSAYLADVPNAGVSVRRRNAPPGCWRSAIRRQSRRRTGKNLCSAAWRLSFL